MNIKDYLDKLNNDCQTVYDKTTTEFDNLGKSHYFSSFIAEFSENIYDYNEREMIRTVANQLEAATLNLTYGMYRQAFSSLRLAFELGLGSIYFSINKLEHNEWIRGENDIKWSKIIDKENGVLSERFCKAFFPELIGLIEDYNSKSTSVYRKLSEFVHGNNQTWSKGGIIIIYDENLKNDYFESFQLIVEILIFVLCCRYLKSFDKDEKAIVSEFLLEELSYISPIREYLGGVK